MTAVKVKSLHQAADIVRNASFTLCVVTAAIQSGDEDAHASAASVMEPIWRQLMQLDFDLQEMADKFEPESKGEVES